MPLLVRLRGKIAVLVHDEQMMLPNILPPQHFAVADDDAVAMVSAEIRVDRQHGVVTPRNIADRLINAALEIVARKGRSELIRAAELNVATK